MSIERVSSSSNRSQNASTKSSGPNPRASQSKQTPKDQKVERSRPEPLFPPKSEPSRSKPAANATAGAPKGAAGGTAKVYAAEEKKEIAPEEYYRTKPEYVDEGPIPKGGREVTIWGRSTFLETYIPKLFQDIPFRPKGRIPNYTKAIPLRAWQNEDGSYALKSPEYGFEILENVKDPKREISLGPPVLDYNNAKPFTHDSVIFGDDEKFLQRLSDPKEPTMIVERGEYVRNPNLTPPPIYRFADAIEAYFFTTEALKTAAKMGFATADENGPLVKRVVINEQPTSNKGFYVPSTRAIHLTETGDYPDHFSQYRRATTRVGKVSHEVYHGIDMGKHGPVAEGLATVFAKKVESDLSERYPSYPLNIDYFQIEEGRFDLQSALNSSRSEGDPYQGDPQNANSVRFALRTIFKREADFPNEVNGKNRTIISLKHLPHGTYRSKMDNEQIDKIGKEAGWKRLERLAEERAGFVLNAFWRLYNDPKSNIGKEAFNIFLGNGEDARKRAASFGNSSMDFAEIRETTIARAKKLPYPANAGNAMDEIWNKLGLTEEATKFYPEKTFPNDGIADASAKEKFLIPYVSSPGPTAHEEIVADNSRQSGMQLGKYAAPFMVAAGSATTIRDLLNPKLSYDDKLKSVALASGMTSLAPELYMGLGKVAERVGNNGLFHKGASLATRTLTKYPVFLPFGIGLALYDVDNTFRQNPSSSGLEKVKSSINLGTTGLMVLGPVIGAAALGVNLATQFNLLDKPIEFALDALGHGDSSAATATGGAA